MKLIADSGSTKTSWRLVGEDGSISQHSTAGLNPYTMKEEEMDRELEGSFLASVTGIRELYFYGSGCHSEVMRSRMAARFSRYLPKAEIHIYDDLLGAARAAASREPAIVGILGTGSNSCLYD